jgi:uncharacterized protein
VSRIFWDTNLFIYLLEDKGELTARVSRLRRSMLARGDQLLTSALTLGEILVKPVQCGDLERARRLEEAITMRAQILPFDLKAARIFAQVRRDRSIRAPDAVQLACAAAAGADLFITNDDRLQGKRVEGIQFTAGLGRVPL